MDFWFLITLVFSNDAKLDVVVDNPWMDLVLEDFVIQPPNPEGLIFITRLGHLEHDLQESC